MTAHTTETGDRPAETPWPIDAIGQRVTVAATVYSRPDPDDEDHLTRYVTFEIDRGDGDNPAITDGGRELVSIREDHVRATVRRIPEPAPEPTVAPDVTAELGVGDSVDVRAMVIGIDDKDHATLIICWGTDSEAVTIPLDQLHRVARSTR